jgi:hypothetical protein
MMGLVLSDRAQRAFDRLIADARRVFGDRFVALVAYEPTASLVFAASITSGDLDALGTLAETWQRDGLRTPLVMTPAEFRRSLDVFPLEYQAILDRHLVLAGGTPFTDASISAPDLRRACEVQAKAQLIHLRQGWLESAGHTEDLAEVIERSAGPLRVLLANVARLNGTPADDPDGLSRVAHELIDMPADLVRALLALESAPAQSRSLVPRLPEYLAALERLWAFIDAWRSR